LGLTQRFANGDFQCGLGRVGKLQYMCPEAYARRAYDARKADVYCLGVMLWMMLIGAPPYQAPQPQNAAFNYIVNGRLADVLRHWKRLRLLTEDALDLLTKMLCYEQNRLSLADVLNHPFLAGPRQQGPEEKVAEEMTDCERLLRKWNLTEIYDVLVATGWTMPDEWHQLDVNVLVFEVGVERQQAVRFMDCLIAEGIIEMDIGSGPTKNRNDQHQKPTVDGNVVAPQHTEFKDPEDDPGGQRAQHFQQDHPPQGQHQHGQNQQGRHQQDAYHNHHINRPNHDHFADGNEYQQFVNCNDSL